MPVTRSKRRTVAITRTPDTPGNVEVQIPRRLPETFFEPAVNEVAQDPEVIHNPPQTYANWLYQLILRFVNVSRDKIVIILEFIIILVLLYILSSIKKEVTVINGRLEYLENRRLIITGV